MNRKAVARWLKVARFCNKGRRYDNVHRLVSRSAFHAISCGTAQDVAQVTRCITMLNGR